MQRAIMRYLGLNIRTVSNMKITSGRPSYMDILTRPVVSEAVTPAQHENAARGKECPGCGAKFQVESPSRPGYLPPIAIKRQPTQEEIDSIKSKAVLDMRDLKLLKPMTRIICSKCHSLKHQKGSQISVSKKTNLQQFEQLKTNKGGHVVLIVDLLDICGTLIDVEQYCGEKKLLVVLNKYDLMPAGYEIHKVKQWIKSKMSSRCEIVEVSSKNKEGISSVLDFIQKAFESHQDCYLVGCTNVGKSTLVNAIKASNTNRNWPTVTIL